MVEKIDLQGSTAITMANTIAAICAPLRHLEISGFQYMRKFSDGSRFILCDRSELMQYFYEESFYPLTWYDNDKPLSTHRSGFEFWPIHSLYNSPEQNILADDMRRLFQISQSVTYLDKTAHVAEIFRFFANDKSIYSVNPRTLFHFMYFFRENMQNIIAHSKRESISVAVRKDEPTVPTCKDNEDYFIKSLPVKRYYLRGEQSKVYLTCREKDCLNWCTQGKNSEETAVILGISKRTVENNIQKIKEKLNCYKQSQLATIAIKLGISHC